LNLSEAQSAEIGKPGQHPRRDGNGDELALVLRDGLDERRPLGTNRASCGRARRTVVQPCALRASSVRWSAEASRAAADNREGA
jgi:hypothetical protein